MIVTFCGHSSFQACQVDENKVLDILEENVGCAPVEFYLGGYGNFDSFAYSCCKKFKEAHPQATLVFVTPYITEEYQKNHLSYLKMDYDCIIYPAIEDKPLRFAIAYRNKHMAESADLVIAYVKHSSGGAYKMLKHAQRLKRKIINLANC